MKINVVFSLIFVLLYCFFVGGLMFLNTTEFGLGDPKFGSSGWKMYWLIWSVFYLPAIIVSLVSLSKQSVWLHGFAMAAILFLIEISFYFDIGLHIIIVELVSISVIFIFLGRALKKHARYD